MYGGRLDAYSFEAVSCSDWFDSFTEEVVDALGKRYFPVYRMADGEFHFLFGAKINWHSKRVRSLGRYVKYEVLNRPWKTSWGEHYNRSRLQELKNALGDHLTKIAAAGKLALYWNENAFHAFTEWNNGMERRFLERGIELTQQNYVPFHFCQALLAKRFDRIITDRNVLIVSGMGNDEFISLQKALAELGASHVELYRCPPTGALQHDYTSVRPSVAPDIVLVAAGIGAARVLVDLRHLQCPVIDVGSYIHVVSGKLKHAHSGFFLKPVALAAMGYER